MRVSSMSEKTPPPPPPAKAPPEPEKRGDEAIRQQLSRGTT
jgi:hypothetical protein